ncbi:MAG: type II toxin-antitoxin system VapC family toxin [Gammaproteobacteria bacterium]|nr:type II toxin-antitoxin system VapC family toxin [Gammaproteobacteria bacterium]
MSEFVLDCSVAVAWFFEDEANPETDALLDRAMESGALVPGLWRLEVGNVLSQAERRRRIDPSKLASYVDVLAQLPIATDTETEERALRETLALARQERLTTYDAAYLEVAMRRGMPLATLDKALIRAARRVGVNTLP